MVAGFDDDRRREIRRDFAEIVNRASAAARAQVDSVISRLERVPVAELTDDDYDQMQKVVDQLRRRGDHRYQWDGGTV
jgi:hypothetical protein